MNFKAEQMRADFPALTTGLALFDAPGGTQVPEQVADAIRETMLSPISNRSPASLPGRNAEEAVHSFRLAAADLMGADPKGVMHGRSSTQLTMDFSRALSKNWVSGDNIVLSKLDHDSNIAPWLIAAAHAGVEVRWAQFDANTSELDTKQYQSLIDKRTQVVALTAASNFIGSKPEVSKIAAIAHAHNAYVYVDAVHYAAHDPLDIKTLGADFTVVSPYKL
ncbi:MAG TPA: aminotransferase class V-fold PLP-dependent enzyme, partial [Microbacteriaceae bacterium]|nr:aminotransferase class V-fold PLP-dependent enzyme [Microbacteriaceae bacterium]